MSETETDHNQGADAVSTETAPDSTQSADNATPAVTTPTEATPPENAVSGAKRARETLNQWAQEYGEFARRAEAEFPIHPLDTTRIAPDGVFIPFGHEWSTKEQRIVPSKMDWTEEDKKFDDVMRRCGNADSIARATGTEAQVCADIAERQRRGIAKYGKTVIGNPLPFLAWLTHFYEELLDAAVYAKRIIHEHENQTQNDAGASGVLPNNSDNDKHHQKPRGGRKPGGGRKPLVCPSCGGIKTIGSSMKDGIPIKRCKVCGHVHKSYPHLANAAKAAP